MWLTGIIVFYTMKSIQNTHYTNFKGEVTMGEVTMGDVKLLSVNSGEELREGRWHWSEEDDALLKVILRNGKEDIIGGSKDAN
jgi:hypothetical protein